MCLKPIIKIEDMFYFMVRLPLYTLVSRVGAGGESSTRIFANTIISNYLLFFTSNIGFFCCPSTLSSFQFSCSTASIGFTFVFLIYKAFPND